MGLQVKETNSACGAFVTGIDLTQKISNDLSSKLRDYWLKHKVLIFPEQNLSNHDLENFTLAFGEFGDDPFFGHIEGHENIAAIRRDPNETTSIFAEVFHTDWSFLDIPPAGTCLYGITIPPIGGNTLFANQVKAYESLPPSLRDRVESLIAIHSAELGYAPTGAYGDEDKKNGRSMNITPSEEARKKYSHPFVRTHHETGEKAMYSSAAYIQGFEGLEKDESDSLLIELYEWQTRDELIYSHRWSEKMLIIWDNRSLLHAATGGYDGHQRLLHRTTIADTQF